MKLLIIEDQKHMAYALEEILKKNKYSVDLAFDGIDGYEYAKKNIYDVIVLDVMLPGIDGFTILKKLREIKINTPIIMLTAKAEVENKVHGLNLGADDYLAKPFETTELLARLNAITRRKGSIKDNYNIKFNDLILDINNLKLKHNEKSFDLTVKECQILELFFNKPNIIISKDTIINKIWSIDKIVIDNNVEVYISFLRKKLKSMNLNIKINTIRGIGYKLVGELDV